MANLRIFITIGDKKIKAWLCKKCPGQPKITDIESHNARLHAPDSPGRTEQCKVCDEIFLAKDDLNSHKCPKCKAAQRKRCGNKSRGVPRKLQMSATGIQFREGIRSA